MTQSEDSNESGHRGRPSARRISHTIGNKSFFFPSRMYLSASFKHVRHGSRHMYSTHSLHMEPAGILTPRRRMCEQRQFNESSSTYENERSRHLLYENERHCGARLWGRNRRHRGRPSRKYEAEISAFALRRSIPENFQCRNRHARRRHVG